MVKKIIAQILIVFQKDQQRGSVLVDSLIASLIIGIISVVLMAMYIQASKGSTTNKGYSNAVLVAQHYLEPLKQYDDVAFDATAGNNLKNYSIEEEHQVMDGIDYTVKVENIRNNVSDITTTPPLDSNIYPYQVTVKWKDTTVVPSADRSIQVAAYYYLKTNN